MIDDDVQEAVRVLGVPQPLAQSADEVLQWLEWYRPAVETAKKLDQAQIDYLKEGGWWPPISSYQVQHLPPAVVTRSLRPGLKAILEAAEEEAKRGGYISIEEAEAELDELFKQIDAEVEAGRIKP